MRVSELSGLNIMDVDFDDRSAKVLGKGNEERIVFFSKVAKTYLKEYLDSRDDFNPALFVANIKPHDRLLPSGIQFWLKELGKRAGVTDVHPHRFRRTLATNLLHKGMALEEVQRILGHKNMNTTMIYCNLHHETVQHNYNKFMSAA